MPLGTIAAIVALSLHAKWADYTNHQLDARVQQLRAAGEPVLVEDFNKLRAARGKTAAAALETALAELKDKPSDALAALDDCESVDLPLRDWEVEKIREAKEDHAAVLEAVRDAAAAESVAVTRPLATPVVRTKFDSVSPARAAANLLRLVALEESHAGDSAAAVRTAGDLTALANLVASEEAMIAELMATGVRAVQAKLYVELAPTLQVGPGDKGVDPTVLRTAINELFDAGSIRNQWQQTMRFERMFQLDLYWPIGRHSVLGIYPLSFDNPMHRYAMRPLINDWAMAGLDVMTRLTSMADDVDLPAYERHLVALANALAVGQNRLPRHHLTVIGSTFSRVFRSRYEILTRREAAATALAVRLYAADHDGRLPAKLEDLVPKYLPRLPRDYLADNRPLHYRGGEKSILWSVGENGHDDNGTEADPNTSIKEQRETSDEVFPLYARPRKAM